MNYPNFSNLVKWLKVLDLRMRMEILEGVILYELASEFIDDWYTP